MARGVPEAGSSRVAGSWLIALENRRRRRKTWPCKFSEKGGNREESQKEGCIVSVFFRDFYIDLIIQFFVDFGLSNGFMFGSSLIFQISSSSGPLKRSMGMSKESRIAGKMISRSK